MRTPSWRLPCFAAFFAVAMIAFVAKANTVTYNFPGDAADMTADGWEITLGNNNNFNKSGRGVVSKEFSSPITNLVFRGYRTDKCTRTVDFTAGSYSETWYSASLVGTSSSNFFTKSFLVSDNVTSFSVECTGGAQNFYLQAITVYTVDPPPSLGPIDNQTVGSYNTIDHLPVYAETDVDGDVLEVSVTTVAGIPAASYGVFQDGGDWFFRFSPGTAGMTSGDVSFTVSAKGIGGTTNVAFTVTVQEGVVKTPPVIYPIADTNVLARRTVYIPFTVAEADGDRVETNVVCVTAGVAGTYGINAETGDFRYTPTVADAAIAQPIHFGIVASDAQGAVTNYFNVTVGLGSAPIFGTIADQTIAFGGTNVVTLALTATDGDTITATNVQHVADAPAGAYSFSNLVFRFAPAMADIGKTFAFTAYATDMDGMAEQDFQVAVILEKPALRAGSVLADWSPTSFVAYINKGTPGAESYVLRVTHPIEEDGNGNDTMTEEYHVLAADFPTNITGCATTNYTYSLQAVRGETTSAWSTSLSISLQDYPEFVPAIPMTGETHGSYKQDFNSLPARGNDPWWKRTWWDGRTLEGWYALHYGIPFENGEIQPWGYGANSSATGVFSFGSEKGVASNRGLGSKNAYWDADCRFAVAFTNTSHYKVSSVDVKFTAYQFRCGKGWTQLQFAHAVSNSVIALDSAGWKADEEFYFDPDLSKSAGAMDPQYTNTFSGTLTLKGEYAVRPGQVLMLRWENSAGDNAVPVGIDDLEVTWYFDWKHTVIYLR